MGYRLPLLLLICFGLIAGCTHPLDIVGEGDILSDSGDNHCFLEDAPCEVVAVNEYQETYRPQARPGHVFVGWQGCGDQQGTPCAFNVAPDVVKLFWFQTAPTLVARFAPACNNAPISSFAAIQNEVFDGMGCASGGCHGTAELAGLRLSSGQSYAEIVNINSTQTSLKRVLPGNANNSYLYRKVVAKTNPGSFNISGSPMPIGGGALSQNQLAALAFWIDAGAPSSGRADDLKTVEQLLGLCN